MNGNTEQIDKQLRTLKIIALAMLVAAPIVYLVIAQIISRGCEPTAGTELVLYLLLMVAIGSSGVNPLEQFPGVDSRIKIAVIPT